MRLRTLAITSVAQLDAPCRPSGGLYAPGITYIYSSPWPGIRKHVLKVLRLTVGSCTGYNNIVIVLALLL